MAPETEDTMEPTQEPAEITLEVVPVAPVRHQEVTMDAAFMLLCQAMTQALEDADDMPSALHAEEIMGWYTNQNTAISWQHAVLLLEKVVGVPLRGGQS